MAPNNRELQWTNDATAAFQEIKDALANATLLVHPQPEAPINIMTDASDITIGAVLQQYLVGQWCPLSYFSRKLSPTEQRYSTFNRELLAVYCAIHHFRHYLEAREFHVLTDHKPLTHSLKCKPDRHSPRQVRHLDFISQFTTDIRHVTGTGNLVADALSCCEVDAFQLDSPPPSVDFQALEKAQPDVTSLHPLQSANSALQFTRVTLPMCTDILLCEMSTGSPQPYVPEHFCCIMFNSLHFLSHPGVRATQRLVISCFFWPGMNADVRQWARSCLQCQRAKVYRHTVTPLGTFNSPETLQHKTQVDVVLLEGVAGDEYVIDVNVTEVEATEHLVHEVLKGLCCIAQSEWHPAKLRGQMV